MPDKSNLDNLPVIEETSLHNIVLRVRDWQETIDKKFNRNGAYLDFENEEINTYKKELLEKGEDMSEAGRFWLVRKFGKNDIEDYENEQERSKHVQTIDFSEFLEKQRLKNQDLVNRNWLDISRFCQWDYDVSSKNYILKITNSFIEKIYVRRGEQKIKDNLILKIVDSEIDYLDLLEINVIGFYFANIIARKIRLHDLNLTYNFGIYSSKIKQLEMSLDVDFDNDMQISNTKIDNFSVEGSNFNCKEFCIWNSLVNLEIENSIFEKKCMFLISSRSFASIYILNSYFYGEFVFSDPVVQGRFVLEDVYFKNRVDLEIRELNTNARIINHEDKILSRELNKTLGKVFRDATTLEFTIKKVKIGSKLVMDYCDFTKLKGNILGLKKLLVTIDENGQKVIAIGKNCEPKPYTYSIQIPSKYKEYYSFIEDFSTLFKRYAKVNHIPDISVAINPIQEGFG